MGNLKGFDASKIEPQSNSEPIPAGWYEAMIVSSEEKTNKQGTGSYIQLRLDVTDGEYINRVLFDRLNLDNPNKTAVEIAQRTLSAICHAVGVLQPNDTSDLHDTPLRVKVAIQPAKDGYDASNVIKAYEAVEGGQKKPADKKPASKKPWE